jgi:phosphatidylserine decarboxylase
VDPLSFLVWRFYYFFRDPERTPPSGDVVVSPADGRIIYVREQAPRDRPVPEKNDVPLPLDELSEDTAFEKGGALIGIYMTPLSVHYNRAPITGIVSRVAARPALHGENQSMTRIFMRILWDMDPDAGDEAYVRENARNTVVINGEIPAVVVQIADRYVDQIDCFVEEGESVQKGERLGMIRMGSQCDLYIPSSCRLSDSCRPGARVTAGETVLASY